MVSITGVTEHWAGLPGEGVEIFKTQLDVVLDNLLQVILLGADDLQKSLVPQSCCEGVICGWGKPGLILSALCWLEVVFGQHVGANGAHFSSRERRCFGVAFPWLLWGSRSGVRCPHPTRVVLLVSGLSALQELLRLWRLTHIP